MFFPDLPIRTATWCNDGSEVPRFTLTACWNLDPSLGKSKVFLFLWCCICIDSQDYRNPRFFTPSNFQWSCLRCRPHGKAFGEHVGVAQQWIYCFWWPMWNFDVSFEQGEYTSLSILVYYLLQWSVLSSLILPSLTSVDKAAHLHDEDEWHSQKCCLHFGLAEAFDLRKCVRGRSALTTGDGQVYVWDVRGRDCVHKFTDEGCIHSTQLAMSPDGTRIACGQVTSTREIWHYVYLSPTLTPL